MKQKFGLVLIGIIIVLIVGIGGKQFMDKKVLEKRYQDGMDRVQKYVTEYLVQNYAGIEKIAWQGVGVEWRNSSVFGPSMFGNYVDTDVKVYVSKDNYFTMDFTLQEEMEYDYELKKYHLTGYLVSNNLDTIINTGIHNAIYAYSDDPKVEKLKVSEVKKQELEAFKKASMGIPNAKVIYNVKIHELKY